MKFHSHEKLILLTGIITAVAWVAFYFNDKWAEIVYGGAVYPIAKWVLAIFEFTLPVPAYLPFWMFLVVSLVILLFFAYPSGTFGYKISLALRRLVLFIMFVASWFYWSWGFNYYRTPFLDRSSFELTAVDQSELEEMATKFISRLNTLKQEAGDISEFEVKYWQSLIQPRLESLLKDLGYNTGIPVRIRVLYPEGLMMRWAAAGMYLPFSGESNIDGGILPVQMPYILAHEVSHAYGLTDEGVCNFIAFIACDGVGNPAVRYSAWISAYRYIAYELRKMDKEAYDKLRGRLDEAVTRDLIAISENSRRFPDLIPQWKDQVYDRYLKSQGVRSGTRSYDEVVMLLADYFSSLDSPEIQKAD